MELDNLMMNKKHFPNWFEDDWDIPVPAHPSMLKTGIEPGLVFECVGKALLSTAEDLKRIIPRGEIEKIYNWVANKKQKKTPEYKNYIVVENFPIPLGKLQIRTYEIALGGSNFISPSKDKFVESADLKLPEQIIKEYCLTPEDDGYLMEYYWHPHNLDYRSNQIFFRNLALVIGNETVKRKYSGVKK